MRQGLLLKLLGINIPVVVLVIFILWLSLDTLAATYFSALMRKYHIAPTEAHQMFLFSIHRYLLWTSIGALLLAALLSFLLTRRVLKPLYEMIDTARSISGGDYSSRVRSDLRDEIGELARAFDQMAMSLERMERLRRDMVADVAHELRTPLTNMRGYLEALQDGVIPPSRETFELLLEETLRLVHLVEDLLKLARADAARSTLSTEVLDLSDLTGRLLNGFQLKFDEKRIRVALDLGETGGRVRADRQKLSQVIENLMRNALQYTPEDGRIAVAVRKLDGTVRLSVENSGPGISEEDLPFIFERFYRGEKSRSRDYGGTGIGLAIVKELVEAHAGRVGVESSSGTTLFWVALPSAD